MGGEHHKTMNRINYVAERETLKKVVMPVSVFDAGNLTPLELVVKYLRENKRMKFVEIAELTNRAPAVINITYKRAKEKMQESLEVKLSEYEIPVEILKDRTLSAAENIVVFLKKEYKLKHGEIAKILHKDDRNIWTLYSRAKKKKTKAVLLPAAIFENEKLSPLELIVKYLRENRGMKFVEIAELTNRDQRAINVTYRMAKKKMQESLEVKLSEYEIPVEVLKDRTLSVSESLVTFLKKKYELKNSEIARILHKDDRNIWTLYARAKKKKLSF